MRNKRIVLFVSIMFVLLTALVFLLSRTTLKETDINVVLESSSYAYLPKSAKNYIKEVYEESGELVYTEKNKRDNVPYLNPMYVKYLELNEEQKEKEGHIPMPMVIDYVENEEEVYGADEIDSSYDLRNVNGSNYVTPVRDQGDFGLCWSFATMGSFESYLLKSTNTPYNAATTQTFNERQMDYITAVDGLNDYDSEYVTYIDRVLGDGGNFYLSSVALAGGVSYVDYDWKTYDDTDVSKMELHEVINYSNSMYEVKSTVHMPIIDFKNTTVNDSIKEEYLDIIKRQIMDYGAVYVNTLWNSYCIYYESKLSNVVIDVDSECSNYGGGHAMIIIGWDDNATYDYCDDYYQHLDNLSGCSRVVSKKGAWILKNSWGSYYSYPYLTYDSLNTGYAWVTSAAESDSKVWDNSYVLEEDVNYIYRSKTVALKDTNIVGTEKLNYVKLNAYNQNGTYEVTVYGNNGTYTKEITIGLPGMVTIDFSSQNVLVDENSTVKISGGSNYIFDIVQVFTSNISENPYIDLSEYMDESIKVDSKRFYSITKNIDSNTVLNYKVFGSTGIEVTNKLSISNNIVAENNINTLISGFYSLGDGEYTIKVYKDQEEIGSVEVVNFQMSGKGTASDPYVIMNESQLDLIRNDLDAYYILGVDIDLTEATRKGGILNNLPSQAYDNGHGWKAIVGFNGNFDGKGHTIKGLYQRTKIINKNKDDYSYVTSGYGGLFGSVSGGVKIKNVILEDFDIECHTQCGALVGRYLNAGSPSNSWTVEFSGIAVKNSIIGGTGSVAVGGLFGALEGNVKSSLNINDIYVDTFINNSSEVSGFGMVAYSIDDFKNVTISNLQMLGFMQGDSNDGSDSAIMVKDLGAHNLNIENILSTVQTENVGGLICNNCVINTYDGAAGSWIVKNVNMLQSAGFGLFGGNNTKDKVTTSNINVVNSSDLISKFTNSSSYSGWTNFSTYWDFKTIDGVARYPALKVADFAYTTISDISYNQVLNDYKYIYEYLNVNNSLTDRLSFKSNNEDILKVDIEGKFIPYKDGIAYVNVQSPYYDGYNRDVKITVDYMPHYTVKYDANGAEGEMEQVEVLPNTSLIVTNSTFTKNYYDFVGWNTEADGSGTTYMPSSMITGVDYEVITLYAQWRGEEFEIAFDANGGVTPISSKVVYYGEVYGELPIPYRDGYGFDGWSVGSGTSLSVDSSKVVYYSTDKRTLLASWNSDEFTVEFKPNGGVGYSDYMSVPVGEDIALKDNGYTRKGYNFVGWNTEEDGSGISYTDKQVINMTNVTNSILTLYAQWEVIEYEVNFDANGGIGTMDSVIVGFEEEFVIPENTFVKEGYTFKEWNTLPDGMGTSYANQSSISVENNITLYAIWNVKKVLVTFNINDGSGRTTTQQVNWNSETNLIANSFSRNGFAFVSWNTEGDGSGSSYSDKQVIKVKDSLTLYAMWRETYSYKISSYTESNGVIDNIPIKTSISTYLSKFTLNTGYTMEVNTVSGYIYTGAKTKIYKNGKLYKEFTNVVRGDVNGDSKVTSADYIKIRKHIMKTEVISNNIYFAAADANQDGKVTSADYVKIRKIIMGG